MKAPVFCWVYLVSAATVQPRREGAERLLPPQPRGLQIPLALQERSAFFYRSPVLFNGKTGTILSFQVCISSIESGN